MSEDADRRKESHPGEVKSYHEGAFIFREHETGDQAFIVKSGKVEIFKSFNEEGKDPREVTLGILESGSMFGEMALIDDELRMATARAVGNVEVFIITRGQFQIKLSGVNLFIGKLLQILAENVRSNSEKVK
ncbi:MAG: cyclic nucleotide-binding domain-containing protein [Rhodospirillales bacterium]|nr:cyclic nucleotide-binding domain-containing protein [Rhodospirillales bacterium]